MIENSNHNSWFYLIDFIFCYLFYSFDVQRYTVVEIYIKWKSHADSILNTILIESDSVLNKTWKVLLPHNMHPHSIQFNYKSISKYCVPTYSVLQIFYKNLLRRVKWTSNVLNPLNQPIRLKNQFYRIWSVMSTYPNPSIKSLSH